MAYGISYISPITSIGALIRKALEDLPTLV
jgi:hypothetical protein